MKRMNEIKKLEFYKSGVSVLCMYYYTNTNPMAVEEL